jgi:glycosyltransferase involved in cell wall biosynthesis
VTFTSPGPELDDARRLADQSLPARRLESIEFLGGVTGSQMSEILRVADVYVSVSLSDGTSTSLLEAMATGAYPVLSDIPANRELLLPDQDNLALVPLDQPAALARTLGRVIADKDLRGRSAILNRDLVMERADSRSTIKQLTAALNSIETEFRSKRIATL